MNVAGLVAMLDTSDPEHPALLSTLDLGADAGPHYLALTRDERRLVVSDYFLNEDEFRQGPPGRRPQGPRDRRAARRLSLDTAFDLDFDTAFPTGPARPHGLAIK